MVLCNILERYASDSEEKLLILDSGGPASTATSWTKNLHHSHIDIWRYLLRLKRNKTKNLDKKPPTFNVRLIAFLKVIINGNKSKIYRWKVTENHSIGSAFLTAYLLVLRLTIWHINLNLKLNCHVSDRCRDFFSFYDNGFISPLFVNIVVIKGKEDKVHSRSVCQDYENHF